MPIGHAPTHERVTYWWTGQQLLHRSVFGEEGEEGAVLNAALSGTVVPNATEAEIVAGGETLIITLAGSVWEAGGTFDAARQAIIDGCTSAGVEATGWNNEVRDNEVVGAVVRTSDTVVTITWTAAASYDIGANETITVTVPQAAVVLAQDPIIATPTFKVLKTAVPAGVSSRTRRGRRRYGALTGAR